MSSWGASPIEDFYEIDFLDVETRKSGDAISVRYRINGVTYVHIVDAGYLDTGDKMIEHVKRYYGSPAFIDNVIVTHPDGDHAAGVRRVVEEFNVGAVWMLRPWKWANELIYRFESYNSVDRLTSRLRTLYPNLAAIEEICERRNIPIYDPFQNAQIGAFVVAAPTKSRYLDLVVASERTPEAAEEEERSLADMILEGFKTVVAYVRSAWGDEVFPPGDTSAENDMSVVQVANIAGEKIMLTGDAGRDGLNEAADYINAISPGFLPGLDRFQVPHHGSRRNVSTAVLDRILGPRLPYKVAPGSGTYTAMISSAKADPDHPRRSVIRACIHRGANVIWTEGQDIRVQKNAPNREGWTALIPVAYPEDQEE